MLMPTGCQVCCGDGASRVDDGCDFGDAAGLERGGSPADAPAGQPLGRLSREPSRPGEHSGHSRHPPDSPGPLRMAGTSHGALSTRVLSETVAARLTSSTPGWLMSASAGPSASATSRSFGDLAGLYTGRRGLKTSAGASAVTMCSSLCHPSTANRNRWMNVQEHELERMQQHRH